MKLIEVQLILNRNKQLKKMRFLTFSLLTFLVLNPSESLKPPSVNFNDVFTADEVNSKGHAMIMFPDDDDEDFDEQGQEEVIPEGHDDDDDETIPEGQDDDIPEFFIHCMIFNLTEENGEGHENDPNNDFDKILVQRSISSNFNPNQENGQGQNWSNVMFVLCTTSSNSNPNLENGQGQNDDPNNDDLGDEILVQRPISSNFNPNQDNDEGQNDDLGDEILVERPISSNFKPNQDNDQGQNDDLGDEILVQRPISSNFKPNNETNKGQTSAICTELFLHRRPTPSDLAQYNECLALRTRYEAVDDCLKAEHFITRSRSWSCLEPECSATAKAIHAKCSDSSPGSFCESKCYKSWWLPRSMIVCWVTFHRVLHQESKKCSDAFKCFMRNKVCPQISIE